MSLRPLRLLTCALALLALHPSADAAAPPKPYKGSLDLTITDVEFLSPTEAIITADLEGRETFLGHFTGQVQYDVDLTTGTYVGVIYKQAANGDLLYETLDGYFTPTGSEGNFAMVGGTGRFENATGSGSYVSVWTDPGMTAGHVTYTAAFDYDASDRRN